MSNTGFKAAAAATEKTVLDKMSPSLAAEGHGATFSDSLRMTKNRPEFNSGEF